MERYHTDPVIQSVMQRARAERSDYLSACVASVRRLLAATGRSALAALRAGLDQIVLPLAAKAPKNL